MSDPRVADLEREVQALRRQVQRVPMRFPGTGGGGTRYAFQVASGAAAGNTLLPASGGFPAWYGIKKTGSIITALPSSADPEDTSADLPDGLGRGRYCEPGTTVEIPCFLLCDGMSARSNGIDDGTGGTSSQMLTLTNSAGTWPVLRVGV